MNKAEHMRGAPSRVLKLIRIVIIRSFNSKLYFTQELCIEATIQQ